MSVCFVPIKQCDVPAQAVKLLSPPCDILHVSLPVSHHAAGFFMASLADDTL